MAEDNGDKTEAPTPRRRTEAREEGTIARSPELSGAVLLIGALMLLHFFGGNLFQTLRTLMQQMIGLKALSDMSAAGIGTMLLGSVMAIGTALAPMLIGIVLIALAVNLGQIGLFFNLERIQPNFAALNPMRGLSSLFGQGQGAVKFLLSLLKVVMVSLVAYSAIHGKIGQIVLAQQLSFVQIFGLASGIIYSITLRIGVLLLVLAIIDYAYQRYRIEQQLKMSKQDIKEEMKRMDGDPRVKARRRQIAIAQFRQRLKNDVPKADVIVTNPTEFAVALKYDTATMGAPRVVAKGQGYYAARIREIAIANGIPILERKPLARALYKMCNVGQEIPEEFFAAVAEILAYVYELSGKMKRRQSA